MFYDNPEIMYENPAPPSDYESEDEVELPVFVLSDEYKYRNCIKVDPSRPYLEMNLTKRSSEDLNEIVKKYGPIEAAGNVEIPEDSKKVKHSKVGETVKSTIGGESVKSRKKSEYGESRKEYAESVIIPKTRSIREEKKMVAVKQDRKQAGRFESKHSDYHCDICNIDLITPSNYHSHMAGKKHKKAEKFMLHMHAYKSDAPVVRGTDSPQTTFPKQPGRERIQMYDRESKMQGACDNSEFLILGLDNVVEIRGYEEIKYFCDVCPAICSVSTLMSHLVGHKHQMNCLQKYHPEAYISLKDRRDKKTDREIKVKLKEAQMKFGRGNIRVFKDVMKTRVLPEPYDPSKPSTSKQGLDVQPGKIVQTFRMNDEPKATDEQFLCRDLTVYHCLICDTHMNNFKLWEDHVLGKKHLKNKKSLSKGLPVASSFREAPQDTTSHLEEMVTDFKGVLVGLNFIQENRSENGDYYLCFLCGGTCSPREILDHLSLMKHKEKYLVKMLEDGHDNSINQIKQLDLSKASKEALIDEECLTMLKVHTKGKPIIKNVKSNSLQKFMNIDKS